MQTAKVFKSGRAQVVRFPEGFNFDAEELCVNQIGDMIVLFPRDKGWDLLEKSLGKFTDDFGADMNRHPGERS